MASYGLYSTDVCIKPFQRMLNEILRLSLKVDGNIGKVTQEAIANYQKTQGIIEKDSNGACYGPITQAAAKPFITKKYLKESDYTDAAQSLGVEVAVVKAFTMTESKEFGFLDSGYPVILFERHKFYQALVKSIGQAKTDKYAAIYPDICNPKPGGYLGGQKEVERINKASGIDQESAQASASWGMFQILASNYKSSGFNSVKEFVIAMGESEAEHLKAFVNFIKNWSELYTAVKKKDWTNMARLYNGPTYAQHTPPYDVQLKNNYYKVVQ